ncbi:MAG TPA: carboxypeptidase-like regulatory domain-containing protein [Candidatus Sulfotelmatobacter sp.]|nr:carboxypeptidase-like regulatory domain-containing protein [Candidatus Sulfotelmatobacter sp.]
MKSRFAKQRSACLLICLLGASAAAQVAGSAAAKPSARAVIDGVVTREPGSEPVKKVLIELIAENQAEGGDYTALSGADGSFHIEGIVPGRYHLFAERTGMLEVDKHRARGDGRVLTLTTGQEVKDLWIRLQAAAVVHGRVTDEDGDPLPNAQVAVLRQTFVSGHGRWEQAGAERTNDLGEYRVAGLPAGSYYVSVSPPPDFKSLIEAAGAAAVREKGGPDKPAPTSYQTTYYPGTADRSQAAPVPLHAGDDFPVDFSLTPSPSLSIRGSVVNLPPRSSAVIMLQSHDFNLVLNGAEMHPDGSFVIRDVAPGAYTILATVENTPVPMMARQALQLVSNSVEDLKLQPQPGGWVHGRLRLESKAGAAERRGNQVDVSQIFLKLRSADGDDESLGEFSMGDGFSSLAHVGADGNFEWKSVPPGNYDVELAGEGGANADLYLKSALAGNHDVDDAGVSVNGGVVMLDLVASANGAIAEGMVADQKGEPVANAVVVAVPEPRLRTRVERYRTTASDQSGRFALHGIQPGDYTLFAWESVEGEAYYNPEFLKTYETQGTALRVSEGDRKTMQVEVIPEAEEQP